MKKFILGMISLVSVVILAANFAHRREIRKSDNYIRNRVLMLTGNGIECSAIQIKAPSGRHYTLSAAHCAGMISYGRVEATAENGYRKLLEFIAIDPEHDLMLLSAFDDKAIDVASNDSKYERIHTLTHGHAMPTYRTDGFLLSERVVMVLEQIWDEEGIVECVPTKYQQLVMTENGFACEKRMNLTMSTAPVIPGSSGGAALNVNGELIGIVSVTDGFFSGLVPLHDIHSFLKNR